MKTEKEIKKQIEEFAKLEDMPYALFLVGLQDYYATARHWLEWVLDDKQEVKHEN